MTDMSPAIIPKSDQINADDLLSGPITIKITDVKIKPGQDQPVSIYFEGSEKAYRCCKSMARVLVYAWGADASKYKGRSLTLFCDPKVKWGGMEVGGIRISHMSDIGESLTMALTVTRANKKPFTVKPLASGSQKAAAAQAVQASSTSSGDAPATAAAPDEFDPLLIKAQEWAESGIEKYAKWWQETLTLAQRKHIGAERHAKFKAIAEKAKEAK